MGKLTSSVGFLCFFFGMLLCSYGVQGYINKDFSWPFVLIVGTSTTLLGIVITVLSRRMLSQRHEQKEE
ncbi:hypothetical protein GCM10007938_39980 [Vibrio zhanjiangensis]|uniref:DUF3955 domain-containing protein n=1 Tax=Vibrio zhanjiangensis TaxID=1046128 RepID=A0ABQ6F3W5_9VIBR|nr:hypothetical protein [Vibrio zhanjiangensis]GLT20215.1 hypothetical protein GCM10007938_39980 [Vibrio zhanjiangensis]